MGGWNEYGEHFTVTGWVGATYTTPGTAGGDVFLQSLIHDSAVEIYPPVTPPVIEPLVLVRQGAVGGTTGGAAGPSIYNFDKPAAMGWVNVILTGTTATPNWNQFGLGDPAGGGIAVDARGRATVVGQTYSDNYPVEGGGRGPDPSPGLTRLPDAVRSTMDLVPVGVGRTDGTGDALPGGLPAGFTGGTTPACALSPFGIQIANGPGLVLGDLTYPLLQRQLTDYEGPAPSGTTPLAGASLLFVRPPSSPAPPPAAPWQPSILGAALQLGFPQPVLGPDLIEYWTLPNPVVLVDVGQPNRPLRQRLMPQSGGTLIPIPAGIDVTMQLICLVFTPVPAGNCTGLLSTLIAGPAIWINN